MKHFYKNGKELKVNDSVLMPEPNDTDNYSNEFVGFIEELTDKGYAIVMDGDVDCFSIESNRLELHVEEYLTSDEIEQLKCITPVFQDGDNYPYSKIEQFKNDNPNYDEEDNGEYQIGRNFITLVDDRDNVISFILVSHSKTGGTYKCIYSDLK